MRVIKPATVAAYWAKHRDAEPALSRWLAITLAADWKSIDDVRRSFPHADAVKTASGATVTVFNIKGNAYRLIVAIHYRRAIVFIRDFMTHSEYSKESWKERH